MEKSTITSKGQTTIPAAIRAFLGAGEGDQLEYATTRSGKVELSLRKRYSWRDLKGILPPPKKALSDKEIRQSVEAFWTRRGPKKPKRTS